MMPTSDNSDINKFLQTSDLLANLMYNVMLDCVLDENLVFFVFYSSTLCTNVHQYNSLKGKSHFWMDIFYRTGIITVFYPLEP